MSKHTPGPWQIDGTHTLYIEAIVRPGWLQEIASVGPTEADGGYGQQQKANARLIAAAPDLLDALQMVSGYIRIMKRDGHQYVVAIDAAIAKATGND